METADSILVNTNLRHLLNKATFAALPTLYQNKLVQLLPNVDRNIVNNDSNSISVEISNSGLNNEFFARACLEWQDRLAEGEFTPENQQKLKLEADKERSKVDPWKLKHFEPIWGDRSFDLLTGNVHSNLSSIHGTRPPIKTTIKLRPSTTQMTKHSKNAASAPVKRLRTVGAVTRSCTSMKLSSTDSPIPDLLPIKQMRQVQKDEVQFKAESTVKVDVDTLSDNIREPQEKCIVNISDTILENNQETIIICSSKPDKRRRSPSTDTDGQSPKRKTPSPFVETHMHLEGIEHEKDILEDHLGEDISDDDKVSETASEIVEDDSYYHDKDKLMDENSSSSSSIVAHNIEEISSNETIETVDSLQLHIDYKEEDHNQTDETSSTTTTTEQDQDDQEEDEQEDPLAPTPDMLELAPMDTDPLQITENDSECHIGKYN